MGNETQSLDEREGEDDWRGNGEWLQTTAMVGRCPVGGLRPSPGWAEFRLSTFLKSFFILSIIS